MKTLDEILEAMTNEICLNSKADCWEVPVDLYGVIVHYLHEYRSDKIKWEADRKSYQGFVDSYIKSRDKHQAAVIELKHKEKEVNEILTDYVALKQWWTEQQVNPPLSWDELKTLEGKPIWVDGSAFAEGFWTIITGFGKAQDTEYVYLLGDQYWKEYMQDDDDGLSWQAFLKERKS